MTEAAHKRHQRYWIKNKKAIQARRQAERHKRLNKLWRKRNRKHLFRYARDYYYKVHYGITIEIYNQLLKSQNHRCAICGNKRKKGQRAFAVDHDHKTGAVRGILCAPCNTLLGLAKDSRTLLATAIKYLGDNIGRTK